MHEEQVLTPLLDLHRHVLFEEIEQLVLVLRGLGGLTVEQEVETGRVLPPGMV
jgi:hypothetical protein